MPHPASYDAVLDFAWRGGEFTASDAIAALGLTRSTIISTINALVELDLLRELPDARAAGLYRAGRPSRRFALNAAGGVVAGIDAGHAHLVVTVADLLGTPLASVREFRDHRQETTEERRAAIVSGIERALAAAGRDRRECVAIGVGVAAPVDAQGRSPQHPTGFWQHTNPDLVSLLADWAPIVRIENDASLAAVAEGAHGAAVGLRDYVALLAGGRLGAGVVIDGRLLRGAHGGAGEMTAFVHVEGVGVPTGLGARLELGARELIERGDLGPESPLGRTPADEVDAPLVLALASAGDPDALRVVRDVGHALARMVSVLGSMFDPRRIIISGDIAAAVGPVIDAARADRHDGLDLPVPEIVASPLDGDIVVTGAVAAALDAARAGILEVRTRHGGPARHSPAARTSAP